MSESIQFLLQANHPTAQSGCIPGQELLFQYFALAFFVLNGFFQPPVGAAALAGD